MNLSQFNINTGFMKASDVKWISDWLEKIMEDEADVNIDAVAKLLWSYKATAYTVKGKGVVITYKLFEPTKKMGVVSINGKSIEFVNTELFANIAKIASNFEVFPKTDGTTQINFTFHGLRK